MAASIFIGLLLGSRIDPGIILLTSIGGRREGGFEVGFEGCGDDEIEEHGAAALRGFVKWRGVRAEGIEGARRSEGGDEVG